MFLSKVSIERPVMVTMGIMVFVVFGILGFIDMPLNMMPDVKIPFVLVQTIYPGAGPREIETQLSKPIEDAVSSVSQIDQIQSYSMENVSLVMIQFKINKDVDLANQEVKDRVDAIAAELPTGAYKSQISKLDINTFPFMDIVLAGNLDARELYDLADKRLQDRFAQIEGVAQVTMTGGEKREIGIKFKDRVIYENQLSLAQLGQILAAQNLDLPGGSFNRGTQEYFVRMKGEFQSVNELAQTEVPTSFGPKKLGDIAQIIDGSAEVRERAIYFNVPEQKEEENIVRISLTNSPDGNIVSIASQIRNQLPAIQAELPPGVDLRVIRDDSDFTRSTVSDTLTNIWMGILLTGLVLFLFLHDLRSTLIVGLSMPISIISTFVFLKAAGFTINVLTLTGLSTSVGILVANSVVVLENIFRHKEMGNNRREAAGIGTSEIAVAVLASTLTNIVVFLPIASMTSMVGQFFKEFALTVTYATIFSLISSFTITPMLASRILPHKKIDTAYGRAFERAFSSFSAWYKGILTRAITSKKRGLAIVGVAILLLISSFFLVPGIGVELMPTLDEGNLTVSVELPQGYNLEQTAKTVHEIQAKIAGHKEVEHVVSSLGTQGYVDKSTNLASMDVRLVDSKERSRTTSQMITFLSKDLASVPNARIKVNLPGGFGGGSGIEFFLMGQDDERLEELKLEVLSALSPIQGLSNLDSSSRPGRAELTIVPKRDRLAASGAMVYDLAMAIRTAVEGTVFTQFREMGNEYDIKVSMDKEDLNSPEKLGKLPLTIYGQSYVLSQLADIQVSPGINKIIHQDRFKAIQFTSGVAEGYNMGQLNQEINKALDTIELPEGYKFAWGGKAQMLNETLVDMLRTFFLAILLTYMLLAAILESFAQPLLILATVPLALIGVLLALFLSGLSMNIFSMMAIIMLVGIVVNNAILILDYANMLRRNGAESHDAIIEAASQKLKPIIMSTLAIAIGMLPMALGVGSAGKEFRQSMGVVSIGGLIASSILTLVIIPVLYYITTRSKLLKNKK